MYAFSAGYQKNIRPVKIECWCGNLFGVRCRLFAYGPLPHLSPDWFYLSGIGLPRFSWERGCQTGVVVVAPLKLRLYGAIQICLLL